MFGASCQLVGVGEVSSHVEICAGCHEIADFDGVPGTVVDDECERCLPRTCQKTSERKVDATVAVLKLSYLRHASGNLRASRRKNISETDIVAIGSRTERVQCEGVTTRGYPIGSWVALAVLSHCRDEHKREQC